MSAWPEGKKFAFTIVDDTDAATVANVKPIYDFLISLGLRTTKTVWPLRPIEAAPLGGETLEDDEWRAWILDLRRRGFEIAFHGVTDHPSTRERTVAGIELWHRVLGDSPRLYASHSGQREAMYWGPERFTGAPRALFRLFNRYLERDVRFYGEVEDTEYFWGDLCRQHVEYSRNFTFNDINTLAADPAMPWHDPAKPFVEYWFSASNGPDARSFCKLISETNQDRLVAERGACIVYTHFAYRFWNGKALDPEFVRLMTRLAGLDGWFVPASELLDHLRTRPGWRREIGRARLEQLQWRWIFDNLRTARGKKYLKRMAKKLRLPV